MAVLLVTSGGRLCAIALDEVREVMRPQPTRLFPSAFSFLEGVAVIRGEPTPVLSLTGLLGAALTSRPGRFVTLKVGARTAALAVDSVLGVRALPDRVLEDMPRLLCRAESVVERLALLDRELVSVLEAARVVPEGVFIEFQGAGG